MAWEALPPPPLPLLLPLLPLLQPEVSTVFIVGILQCVCVSSSVWMCVRGYSSIRILSGAMYIVRVQAWTHFTLFMEGASLLYGT